MRFRPLGSLALAAALWLAAMPPAAAETVAEGVFAAGLLAEVKAPAVFRYRFERHGEGIAPAQAAPVAMQVRAVEPDGQKAVFFDLFEGQARRQFGPMAAREQNPLVIVFLQRDVTQMSNLTGGAAGYFQQQIRKAFNAPAESGTVEVALGERKIAAKRLVIRPFRDDPNLARFPRFKDKAYEFVVAAEVPGGLYRIASRIPDPADSHLILEESMTFEEARP